jgi:hypothetical protein
MAIVLMGLVGVALACLSSLVAYEARRTRAAKSDAQLRQMLIAGAFAARGLAASQPQPSDRPQSISLPKELAADAATLTLRISKADSQVLEMHIDAKLDQRRLHQVLRFAPAPPGWELTEARLGD